MKKIRIELHGEDEVGVEREVPDMLYHWLVEVAEEMESKRKAYAPQMYIEEVE